MSCFDGLEDMHNGESTGVWVLEQAFRDSFRRTDSISA
jgi:hypothetical protein